VSSRLPWHAAGRVAGALAGDYPLAASYHLPHLTAELVEAVGKASVAVEADTGLVAGGSPEVVVVGRAEWANRNLAAFSQLLEPVERRLAERAENSRLGRGGAAFGRMMVAAETGALLAALSRRVLGQYELVLPASSEAVAFVGANVLALERKHQLKASEFRYWIALHECTHRAQFLGVPWLRQHFLSLVARMVETAPIAESRWQHLWEKAQAARREGRPLIDERGLLGLFATTEQRATLDEVQALMAVLEGHGHVVMNRIGERHLKTAARMNRLLKMRRADPRVATLWRLTGLEMKARQYELGERFVGAVEGQAGWAALDVLWKSPDHLPTLEEVERPERWLARVA